MIRDPIAYFLGLDKKEQNKLVENQVETDSDAEIQPEPEIQSEPETEPEEEKKN